MTNSTTKQSPTKATTQSFTEIEEIQDDVVLMRDFSAVTVVEVGAVNFWLLSQDEQVSMIQSYSNLLNSLSFPVQILIVSKKWTSRFTLNTFRNVCGINRMHSNKKDFKATKILLRIR